MADILEEVLQEQIDEKKFRYFRKCLPIIIVTAIIIAILIFYFNWYNNRLKLKNIKLSDNLISTIHNNTLTSSPNPNKLNEILDHNNHKILGLGELEKVNIKISSDNKAEAIELLEQIINYQNYDKVITSYAKILWLSIILDKEYLNDKENDKLQGYLNDFNEEHQPFYGIGSLFKALWHIKNNQSSLALNILKNIIYSKSVSDSIKDQAKAIISNLAQAKAII